MGAPKLATADEVKSIVRSLVDRDLYRPLVSICREHHVSLDDVLRKVGTRQVVRARDACFAKCAAVGLSTTETGALMGYEHSSVSCGLARFRAREKA